MASARTDVHRPSVMDPADYIHVGEADLHHEEGSQWIDPPHDQAMGERGTANSNAWACAHCGQGGQRYLSFFLHEPSGEYIWVGQDCAAKMGLRSRDELKQTLATERRNLAIIRGQFLTGDPAARRAVELATAYAIAKDEGEELGYFAGVLADMGRAFNRDGSLSAKQLEFAERCRVGIIEEAEEAQRRAERDAALPDAAPVIEGRIEITGQVLGTKYQESNYGSTLKMLLIDDRGFKLWGTVPRAIDDVESGDRVSFTALVERSDDDECFGFYTRPTKATIEEVAE